MKTTYILKLLVNALHFPIRKRLKGRALFNKIVVLDFNNLDYCNLFGCQLVYLGIGPVTLTNSHMEQCEFAFAGAAARSLSFIRALGKNEPRLLVSTFPEAFEAMGIKLTGKP